ncbi:replication protein P [Neptuniibacter halophilus]|uniref:replication protein P n=1 Tax=Neptuniibacter halophilus TaxID=651666 RepID=UPI002573118E|nr:replication protein P [Neptuniibacter halophilus]
MSEIYGAQFANQYGEVGGEAFQTWGLGLRGMTAEQIKHGFTKLLERERTFVPNLNEFRKLCQVSPEELGMPDLEAAYQEAASKCRSPSKKPWSHPGVYHAGKAVGWFELGSNTREKTFPAFKTAYNDICDRITKGEQLELPDRLDRTKLEQHQHGDRVATEENKAAARKALAEMKEAMGL